MMDRSSAILAGLVLALLVLAGSAVARADDPRPPEVGLALDLAGAVGLDDETFGIGAGQSASLALLVRPHPVISIAGGAHIFALYGERPLAFFGTRLGLRLHWGELFGIDPDAWLEVSHVYGLSGPVVRHGLDFGIGIAFSLFDAVAAGPSIRVQWIDDPDGTDVWILLFGLTIVGWPGRPDDAPEGWVSRARAPRHVTATSFEEAHARAPAPPARPWLLPDIELFGVHGVDDDHRDAIGFGGGATAAVDFPIVSWLGVHAGVTGMVLTAQSANPVAWAGTRLGLRLHWTDAAHLEGDGWLDAHHVYGVSGGVATHGADVGAGYAFDVTSFLRIGPAVRLTILTDPGAGPAMMLSIGLSASIRPPQAGPGNTDGDTFLDRDDRCHQTEVGRRGDRENPGCPIVDRDADGVPDDQDLCDSEPAGADPDPARRGCPLRDRDGDGVVDAHDFCPEVSATGDASDPLRDGCPFE